MCAANASRAASCSDGCSGACGSLARTPRPARAHAHITRTYNRFDGAVEQLLQHVVAGVRAAAWRTAAAADGAELQRAQHTLERHLVERQLRTRARLTRTHEHTLPYAALSQQVDVRALARRDEQQRVAAHAETRRAPAAVHVLGNGRRRVVLHDPAHARQIEAARSYAHTPHNTPHNTHASAVSVAYGAPGNATHRRQCRTTPSRAAATRRPCRCHCSTQQRRCQCQCHAAVAPRWPDARAAADRRAA
jgi:hypothetical protein